MLALLIDDSEYIKLIEIALGEYRLKAPCVLKKAFNKTTSDANIMLKKHLEEKDNDFDSISKHLWLTIPQMFKDNIRKYVKKAIEEGEKEKNATV